jgi:Short C-terminal domain
MRRVARLRTNQVNLLVRIPCTERTVESRVASLIVNTAEQVKELADLFGRGLLSREEFERQRAKVLEA